MLKRKIIGLLSVVMLLVLVMPLTVFADSDQEYDNIVFMTKDEVDAILIANGINLDKKIQVRAGLTESNIIVSKLSGKIGVTYYTSASLVANEIGVRDLDFYENSTELISDYKDYYGFVQSYSGGFYYTAPSSGKRYSADCINYAIFTASRSDLRNYSGTVTY